MSKHLRSAVLQAYRNALVGGGDAEEAFETALSLVNEAEPHLDEEVARQITAEVLAGAST